MAKRRSRRNKKTHPLWIAAAIIVLATVSSHPHNLKALAIGAGICLLLGAWIGHRISRRRRLAVIASRKPATRARREPAVPKPPKAPALPSTKQARQRGWLPPASTPAGSFGLSEECLDDQCVLCSDPENCSCSCGHDSAKIVARNKARYDQEHGNEIPPY
jgi:hypothetical protein